MGIPSSAFPSDVPPVAVVPIRLPATMLSVDSMITTPLRPLAEITFPSSAPLPPTVLTDPRTMRTPRTPLPRGSAPVTPVPIRFPRMTFAVELSMSTPSNMFPEITLPSPGPDPPIRLPSADCTETPVRFGLAEVPAGFVPMKFPCTVTF
jgi:hypothetical protein